MKKQLLLNFKKNIKLVFFFCFIPTVTWSQVTVTGRVTGPDGTGIPSISVTIQNTNFGAATDKNGQYTINAGVNPGNYTLVFSGVGFKNVEKPLTIGTGTAYTLNASLSADVLNLDEFVVTGTTLGTTRRQLGNYISTIKADQLNKGATSNVLAALQGKTAGAQIIQNSGDPAGGISVRLRGISSVNSSSEPLYIVDGVIVNNSTNRVTNTSSNYDGGNFVGTIGQNRLVDINPADIERIEVLNGAAAAAIYGSRANAGVVQIFTKRGSTGAPTVSFGTSLMISTLRKSVDVNQAPTKFGGSVNAQTQDILVPAWTTTTPVTRYDYNDYIFRTGIGTENNVSVSGGMDKTKYYASASYFYNEGIIKNTDFNRYSFRLNLDQTLNNILSFNVGLNYINSTANEKPDGNSFFSPMNSINIIGNFHDIWTRDALGNIKAVGERGRVNPVSIIEDIKQKQQTSRVLASAGIKLKPLKGLSFDYVLGIDNYAQRGETVIPPFAYNVNPAFWGGGINLDATLNGYASTATNNFFQINHELSGNYQFKISSKITSTSQVGYSLQYEKNNFSLLQGRGLAPLISTVAGASTQLPGADERSEISISGVYFQQNFKFNNQFFVTGAVRVDGSSVFGENQRNQSYYKASGSYILSETDFWTKSSLSGWWDLLKFRIAYGQSGNLTGIGAYQRFNAYTPFPILTRNSFNSSTTLANEDIKPERQNEWELGADMSFLDNRIGLQFNYYNKKVSDLLINRFVAPTSGFSSFLNNIGSLDNKGFEIVLTGTPVSKKDFRWDVTTIFNHNRNKAVNIGQQLILFSTNQGAPVAILQGQPVGVFYGTFFARDNSGGLVKNTAGIPLTERGIQNNAASYTIQRDPSTGLPTGTVLRKVIGDPNPDWTGSMVNEISYKKFSFRAQLDAVQGVDVFNADWRTRQGVGNGKEAEKEHMGQYPRGYILGIYAIEEWRIDDGSFVKLREVSLSYNLGQKLKGFRDLTISISGRNLISWDNYKGYDPEVNAGGQSTILRGIDFGAVPIPRTFSFGIQTKF